MGFLRWLLRRGPRIEAHTLGVLDLSGGTAGALMAADRTALAPLFRRVSESTDAPPRSTLLPPTRARATPSPRTATSSSPAPTS
jgi:hypothetical protein